MADNTYASPSSNVTGEDSYGSGSNVATSTVNILRMTKGWARFLSVLAYLGGALLIIVAVFNLANLDKFAEQFGGSGFGPGAAEAARIAHQIAMVVLVLYIVMAVIVYIIPAVILGAYASRIGGLIANPSAITLDMALDQQRRFFKYFGILAIVFITLIVLVLVWALSRTPGI